MAVSGSTIASMNARSTMLPVREATRGSVDGAGRDVGGDDARCRHRPLRLASSAVDEAVPEEAGCAGHEDRHAATVIVSVIRQT